MHETITVNGCPEYQARATAKVRRAAGTRAFAVSNEKQIDTSAVAHTVRKEVKLQTWGQGRAEIDF